ncbi:hypothetical protein P879_02860 [Paragonimus westermani]|uniref:ATP-binding cassette, subfamily B (MDR/TAP), member 1 n=1 Tax=Paragonimus westermani TaxID=34504 RepID=A0A8T0DDM5_9TREM|nr:hypothetical protein P879_02860 [Paragonimus westermani]
MSEYQNVRFWQLFRYADWIDKTAVISGILCSAAAGVGFPLNILIFRMIINSYVSVSFSANSVYKNVVWFAVLGVTVFVLTFVQSSLLGLTSSRQARRIRLLYLQAILRQDPSWFDQQASGELISRLSENIDIIESGIGTKLAEFVQNISGFLAGIVISFALGWKLSLVATAMLPTIVIFFALFGFTVKRFTAKELDAYGRAGAIANEVLFAVRTVMSFGGEQKELKRYTMELTTAESVGIKKSMIIGGVMGGIGMSLFCTAALIFWYGIELLLTENYESGTVIAVFINIIVGSIFLGNALPSLHYFLTATASAEKVYSTIERIPPIDKERPGLKLSDFKGNVRFEGVRFAYPTRPDMTITIEDIDLRDLDLKAFRSQLGCVHQEPVLFQGTLADNIRMGKLDATQQELEEAAKLANAHDFITQFPKGYDTLVQERGVGLSGGQKQRIAIARALVRKPTLLLLDEATSALDTKSERQVQAALDKACTGRTAIIVAHRLTTVRNADRILVLDKGIIRESGTHDELVAKGGLYAIMLNSQKQPESKEDPELNEELQTAERTNANKDLFLDSTAKSNSKHDHLDDLQENASVVSSNPTLTSHISSVITSKYRAFSRSPIVRILRLNRPELTYIICGCVSCVIVGASQPAFGLLYSQVFQIFALRNNPPLMRSSVQLVSGLMVLIGVLRFLSMLGEGYFFGVSGERLTRRVRCMLFQAILNQELAWFDRPKNQPGNLTARLATEASKIKSLSGSQLGFIIEAGVLIKRMRGDSHSEIDNSSMGIAQEAISTERTVFALNLECYFYDRFKQSLGNHSTVVFKETMAYALLYALTQSIVMFCFASVFSLGAYLIEAGELTLIAVFRVFIVLNISAHSLGRAASIGPETALAKEASKSILVTLDRVPHILTDTGEKPEEPFSGHIEFKRVYFKYPTRSTVYVLKNFSHVITPGQTVALVGQSGCGKSTLLLLVQRLYDPSDLGPDSGIFFDGRNLRQLAPSWIRRQIGIVSQEPNLFNLSIRENIAYGDNTREVPMEDIIEAARLANIHDFISALPEGYETSAGERGTRLSGGQKQRIAIARALVRKPPLLLLDEATSALDNESERVVQKALDAAVGSRTSLVVAHRLSTVENAELVVVLQDGRKIEAGPPRVLLDAKGVFYALHHTELAMNV